MRIGRGELTMNVSCLRYDDLLTDFGLTSRAEGVWAIVGQASGEYGWKLHLSSVQSEAADLLAAVVGILVWRGTPFKVARDTDMLGMLNEGALGATQVGKFATLYPDTPSDSLDLARELIDATQSFHGPRIVTDLHLGGVVYARYGSYSPRTVRDRLGLFVPADESNRGGYTVPFVPPAGIENPFAAYVTVESWKRSGSAPIGPGYLLVRTIQAHAKGSVFLAIDLRHQASVDLVVLKEGRRHCMSDMCGRHMWDRLQNQASTHTALAGKAPVPAAGALFEYADNLYLPLEFIRGRDFGARPAMPYARLRPEDRRSLLAELAQIELALRALHEEGFVHRDLSMRNIRVTAAKRIFLIDLEICHRVGEEGSPLGQGTPGFVSPQQLANERPAFSDDTFAFGAVMTCALTGLDPQRVLYAQAKNRARQLQALSGAPENLCRLVAACTSDNPADRPDSSAIERELLGAITGASFDEPGRPSIEAENYRPIVAAGLRWLVEGAPRQDQKRVWTSPDLDSSEHANLKLVHSYRVYRSANRGVAGVVYVLAKLHRFGFKWPDAAAEVGAAVDWLLEHRPTPDDQMVGLHFGEAGVAVAIAETVAACLIERGPWLHSYMEEALSGPLDWPDLTHGAAGQGFAAFSCACLLGDESLADLAKRCADFLIETQEANGGWILPAGVTAMSGGTYTGFAHGVAGVVAFLARYARRSGSAAAHAAAERGGQWLLKQARPGQGGMSLWWPVRLDGEESWAWWCHGAPGVALGLLELFELTGRR